MNKYIECRVIEESKYIIETSDTIRNIALKFHVSKSTVHKDLNERLLLLDKKLYSEVSNILKYHLDIRHIRGGNATKYKYLEKKLEI